MKTIAITLIVSLLGLSGSAFCQEAGDWRRVAESVPLGSRVKVQTTDGQRFSGTLLRVDSTALSLKQNTRYPEPAITVAFSDVAKFERHKEGGFNVANAIAIGAAAGAGAMLTLILFAMQLD